MDAAYACLCILAKLEVITRKLWKIPRKNSKNITEQLNIFSFFFTNIYYILILNLRKDKVEIIIIILDRR